MVLRRDGGAAIADRCLIANTARLRLVGLLGRRGLADDEALLLRGSASIHMFFMRFPIDAVFLDQDDVVVKVVPHLQPWRLAAARGARSVVELPAGTAQRSAVAVGDRLVVT